LAVHSVRPFGGSAATILHQVGLDDWVVAAGDALAGLASKKANAGAIAELESLRQTLRRRMQSSPLLDTPGFTRELEEALLAMREMHHLAAD
jgi:predicted O-linked N-acetylglucosamine transferase (SPINDLY family)